MSATTAAAVRNDLIDVVVDRTEYIADGVLSIDLVSAAGQTLPHWTPGAHVDLHLPSGLIRSYSLCGDVDNLNRYRIAILCVTDGRGGSAEVHNLFGADPGGTENRPRLQISRPRNNFELVEAPEYLFIAGGIGITPLLPMIESVVAEDRSWRLVYGGRTIAAMAFRERVEQFRRGRVELVPQDTDGLIDIASLIDTVSTSTHVYVCGPAGLLDAAQETARRSDASARLHLERFSGSGDATDSWEANTAFEVEMQRCGHTISVARTETILQKVLEVLPGHPWSCEEGICGSCESTVLSGEVEHRDEILTDEEKAANETMFICVSRCRGDRLVLDL